MLPCWNVHWSSKHELEHGSEHCWLASEVVLSFLIFVPSNDRRWTFLKKVAHISGLLAYVKGAVSNGQQEWPAYIVPRMVGADSSPGSMRCKRGGSIGKCDMFTVASLAIFICPCEGLSDSPTESRGVKSAGVCRRSLEFLCRDLAAHPCTQQGLTGFVSASPEPRILP